MKKFLKIVLLVLLVLGLGFTVFLGYQINLSVTNLTSQEMTREAEKELLKSFGKEERVLRQAYGYRQVEVENSKDHYPFLVDAYGENPDGDIFILLHSLGVTGRTMVPFGKVFLDRGYNVMMYDQQNSGHHPVLKNNMGVKENQDLIDLIHYVKDQNPNRKIHIFAESYGAHTVLHAYPEIKDDIGMIILDSPMAQGEYYIDQGFREAADESNLPYEVLKVLGDAASKTIEGYAYHEVNGITKLDHIDNPILIISNEEDEVTPHEDALAIYEKARGDREMVLSHSKHADMYNTERDRYIETIDHFLQRHQ